MLKPEKSQASCSEPTCGGTSWLQRQDTVPALKTSEPGREDRQYRVLSALIEENIVALASCTLAKPQYSEGNEGRLPGRGGYLL